MLHERLLICIVKQQQDACIHGLHDVRVVTVVSTQRMRTVPHQRRLAYAAIAKPRLLGVVMQLENLQNISSL